MGEVFAGRYELIDQIGLGGMGSIWRVRDLRTGARTPTSRTSASP